MIPAHPSPAHRPSPGQPSPSPRPSPGQPSPSPHHRHCVVGGANTCGKGNYCKPLSSRSHKFGGRGLCAPHPTPIPVVVPSGVGGRCNLTTHPQQPCKSNLVCNKGTGLGGDGTCVIPGAHRHQRTVPAHLALPDWDIGVGEADFGNISIANVGDIYLPVQNYMGEEGPGPQAQSMWRPGQDKNYHYK